MTSCIEWAGSRNRDGYGVVGGEMAHRRVYELEVGPIPPGLELDHLCRNRACVNPEHLEPVTHAENVARSFPATKPACKNGHEFTPENTYAIPPRRRGGKRQCRECNRIAARRYKQKKAAS